MVEDQRFASTRPDVLVYSTDPLDADVTIAGPLDASLSVSTSGTDSDWVVKVIDAFPEDSAATASAPCEVKLGGYQMLVRGDVMRGKFRNSLARPEPFVPGRIARVEFELQDAFHTFRKGHRIMVQVQSTWPGAQAPRTSSTATRSSSSGAILPKTWGSCGRSSAATTARSPAP
jgi:predicted acyl esterase